MLYLGWMAAAFFAGILLTLRWCYGKGPSSLQERFAAQNTFIGKSYWRIRLLAGAPPCHVAQRKDGSTLRTWQQGRYTITLLFDPGNICLGVEEEREGL